VHFAAFISYRHVEPDRRWATWLHKRLETYRVPKGITSPQVGARRIGRVFRDDEELAASSDLSRSIKDALAQSEYLIVICSPEAAESNYVNREIREFAALGRQDKILALLIRGEPENAFPTALRELASEPLAADVRGNTAKSKNLAALRILAAMLNCTFDALRRRERLRIRRRIELTAFATVASILLTLAVRYGLYRLSLENRSIGTYDLVVRHGLDFMEPVFGSRQPYIQVSDTLYEVSSKGQAPFARGISLFFPAYSQTALFRWLNSYYLDELKQPANNTAPASEFFIEQLQINDQESLSELLRTIRIGSSAAGEVVLAHRLTENTIQTALTSTLASSDAKVKARSLNTLHELYGDDSSNRDFTNQVLTLCDAEAVRVLIALSYEPDQSLLAKCATSLSVSKKWKDAASLVVRFQLPHVSFLPWLTRALDSSIPDEFLAAADVVTGLNLNDPHTMKSLRNRLSDSNEGIKNGAALALWSLGDEGDAVRQDVRGIVATKNKQGPVVNYYLALLRSPLSDDEMVRSLQPQLTSVGARDFTYGWLVSAPDALDVIDKFKAKSKVDVCLSEERKARTEDYAQAILTARAVMLGCREQNVVDALETYIRTGAPGLLGTMLDPKMSEAYGNLLVESKEEAFEDGLDRLWNLLKSQRSESSSNYRLAVEYGIARLVSRAGSDSEARKRYSTVMEKAKAWENDLAPHRRAAYVNMSKLIREGMDRKRLRLLGTQF